MTDSIQIPVKGQTITADWAAKVTRAANAVGALGSAGMLVREGGNGIGFEPLPENPKLRSSGGAAAADKGVFRLALTQGTPATGETEAVAAVLELKYCYFGRGGRIFNGGEALDITEDVGVVNQSTGALTVTHPYLAVKLAASDNADDEEIGVKAYDSFEAMTAASEDLDYYILPLYKLTESAGIDIDFRTMPVAAMGELAL